MNGDPFALVEWGTRTVELRSADGRIAFACAEIEAPTSWSDTAVATVCRRYFARLPDGSQERSVRQLIERVT
ncbi:MAG TPA: hypothetical protein VED41_05750, partial [Solirubrobacteraceae bacterium]|nr:hypothetical protein [Solirubrobacteraceae bacterium]